MSPRTCAVVCNRAYADGRRGKCHYASAQTKQRFSTRYAEKCWTYFLDRQHTRNPTHSGWKDTGSQHNTHPWSKRQTVSLTRMNFLQHTRGRRHYVCNRAYADGRRGKCHYASAQTKQRCSTRYADKCWKYSLWKHRQYRWNMTACHAYHPMVLSRRMLNRANITCRHTHKIPKSCTMIQLLFDLWYSLLERVNTIRS